MLKIKGLLSIDSWNTTSKVVNPRNPNNVYQCNSLCRNQFMNTQNPYVEPKEEGHEIAE